ncbi:MAG: CRISPR system precrRNA processing endoribonuclease RAMP protein Cas6 [Faecalibacterium sp.]
MQSLIAHWNTAFPEYALIDPDALQALQQGLHIVDYNLHTTRYLLKETRIPAFQGNVTIEARLAPPLLELWNALLSFASHGGVGIKTTLGMGGTAVDFYKKTPVI